MSKRSHRSVMAFAVIFPIVSLWGMFYCSAAPVPHGVQVVADSTESYGTESYILDGDTVIFKIDRATVVYERPTSSMRGTMLSKIDVDLDMINAFPKVLGNSDPLRYLQSLPGVQTNSEFDTGIYIQGCDNAHNDVSIAGVPLYGVSHLFGFFSVFNPSHFPKMTFTGATGPKNANMIGGMIRMELPSEVPAKVGGEVNVGIMSAQGTLKIPLGKKGGLFISARQSYLNLLYKRWLKLDGSPIKYDFGDYNMTWFFAPGDNDKVWADFYFGRDYASLTEIHYDAKAGMRWGNHLEAVHWEHVFSDKVKLVQTWFNSGFRFNMSLLQDELDLKMPSHIESIGYKAEVAHGDFLSGLNATWYHVLPQNPQLTGTYNESDYSQERQTGLELSLYTNYSRTFNYKWKVEAGLTGSAFMTPERKFFWGLSPTVSLSYLMPPYGAITIGYGWQHQYLFQTGLTGIGLPTEFWFLSGELSRPQISQYVSLGYEAVFLNGGLALSAELYYKKLYNQVEYKGDLFDFLNSSYSLEDALLKGRGTNYGASIMLHKQSGKLTGWVSYSYSRALRRFDYPEYPSVYPANHDRPHKLTVTATYHLKKWDFGANFVYASGNPFTAPKSFYITSGFLVPEYGEHNANRMRPYIRLDLSVNYNIIKDERQECGVNFSLYNVLARKNDVMYRLKIEGDRFAYAPMSFFLNLVPSISYYHKF